MPVKPRLLVYRASCRQCGHVWHREQRSDVWMPVGACPRCASPDPQVDSQRGHLPVLLARLEDLFRSRR
ncbi:Zn finger protein HypA/HybF involved in hydrogenase expression [Paucibacter oligotrophus]|uniref:Zn finger protein HypA/HybF involved in hydrogenase expression n=1 Tax=Roseateles oligotrophus TaxID=1769250 RepID=A0A840L9G4_9BURK|nr:hypothetical protein [Roseateles oligotrophus]MBB4845224.1 Zn finger protein HypA/HybF involved in hydrogenase expression [Roseateles oligotrophus]